MNDPHTPALPLDIDRSIVPDGGRITGSLSERSARVSVRALSERVLWIEVIGYQCTVVLGPSSALVIDPLDERRAAIVSDLLATQFGTQVSAVAYSHWHSDHIGGAGLLRERSADPEQFTVFAEAACAAEVQLRSRVPAATHELAHGVPFEFEGIEIVAHRVGGHTADHVAFLLPGEGVLHAVDLVHPAQAEYFRFGGAPDMAGYQRALDALASLDWRVMTAGHGQLGWRGDVELAVRFAGSLREQVALAIAEYQDRARQSAPPTRPLEAVDRLRRGVAGIAMPRLLAEWGDTLPGLDLSLESLVFGMLESVLHHE